MEGASTESTLIMNFTDFKTTEGGSDWRARHRGAGRGRTGDVGRGDVGLRTGWEWERADPVVYYQVLYRDVNNNVVAKTPTQIATVP
jgi:hypothetical protein